MNNVNRRLLVAAVFHFAHPVKKDSYFKKNHKLTQNSVSFRQLLKQTSFKMLYEFST